jgi:hypothetical protein
MVITLRALGACLLATVFLGGSSLRADTIFLRDGNQIVDCKVTKETDSQVHVRTPVGDMVVPRTEVFRIQRTKSVYDQYTEQLAAIKESDAGGLLKLAMWCRSMNGLRKESDELLARVIGLNENQAQARRLLGHVKLGGEWVAPPPLSLRLKSNGRSAGAIQKDLALFLETRKDVRIAPEAGKAGAGDSTDVASLEATLIITRKAAGTFFGTTVGQPTVGATVRLQASAPWLGKTPLKSAAEGQVPAANGADEDLAVQNALGSSSVILHRFFDQLTELRLKKLEEEFRKKERDRAREAAGSKA